MPKRTDNFQKFVKQKKGSAIKEELRQQKKKDKKDRAKAIEEHFDKKRLERQQKREAPAPAPTKTVRPNKYPQKETGTTPAQLPRSENISGDVMPLNKYIAHSGTCSRRDAAIMVKEGKVSVNGEIITEPGSKVSPKDVVKVNSKKVTPSRNFVYILLNKPKDYITTSDDPQGRKTVLELVRSATDERIYPVGRLDRNTSGVLLLTNDGELAQKLSHPKHEVKKIYEVKLDRPVTKGDLEKIAAGITLEDGFVAPDVISYADAQDKSIVGVEIHSGRNRIVRRIFEHFKYDVKALDRVMFAGLTKKDVQRGKWRFLKEKEIRILRFMNQSFLKIKS